MKIGGNENIDIDAYRQQFHEYAYLRKPVEQEPQEDLGPISSLFSKRIAPPSGSIAPNEISQEIPESSALPKEASELLAELIGLEQSDIRPKTSERSTPALNATTYEMPSLTEKEVRERPLQSQIPPSSFRADTQRQMLGNSLHTLSKRLAEPAHRSRTSTFSPRLILTQPIYQKCHYIFEMYPPSQITNRTDGFLPPRQN